MHQDKESEPHGLQLDTGVIPADIPMPVADALDSTGGSIYDIQIAVKSDLGPDGQFGEQWLLIDTETLYVFDRPNTSPAKAHIRHRFTLDSIEDAKVERCVGNGLMQVTIEDQPHVLLHYSNDLTDRFGRVAHYLHERAINGLETPVPDAAIDSHTCLVCGRYIADASTKVCPCCCWSLGSLLIFYHLISPGC
jgi:hypothetical protein